MSNLRDRRRQVRALVERLGIEVTISRQRIGQVGVGYVASLGDGEEQLEARTLAVLLDRLIHRLSQMEGEG